MDHVVSELNENNQSTGEAGHRRCVHRSDGGRHQVVLRARPRVYQPQHGARYAVHIQSQHVGEVSL